MGQRIDRAVPVVLRRDPRERVGLIAVALEIGIGDPAEHPRKTAGNGAFLRQVAGLDQHVANRRA